MYSVIPITEQTLLVRINIGNGSLRLTNECEKPSKCTGEDVNTGDDAVENYSLSVTSSMSEEYKAILLSMCYSQI